LPFLRFCLALVTGAILVATATQASAFTSILLDWQQRYGATSPSGDNAGCQLCHLDATGGGDPWNGYGWDIGGALIDPDCDLNLSGNVTNEEAFFCVELLDSDGQGDDNVTEIGLGTQPGWTEGPFNTLYFRSGQTLEGQLPPDANAIGPLDPTGSEPPPPPPPPPPGDDEDDLPPGQLKRNTIVVKPGQSIQAAIDRAEEGTRIYVLAGVYRETGNPTNGLNITKNGIRLIGQKTRKKRVILENAGNQRNGIVVVPPAEKDCMGCHSDMAPPFPLLPGVEPGPDSRLREQRALHPARRRLQDHRRRVHQQQELRDLPDPVEKRDHQPQLRHGLGPGQRDLGAELPGHPGHAQRRRRQREWDRDLEQ
jgi:hypothetical protein